MADDAMIPLSRQNPSVGHASPGGPGGGTTIIEGRILLERSAFVAHSFEEADVQVANFFISILEEMSVRCTTGEKAEAGPISEKIKRRIVSATWFVGIFTRRDKIEGSDEWRTTDWLLQELAFAVANNKGLILLKEEGVRKLEGLQGDHEYIEFDRAALHKSVCKVLQMVWSLNQGRIKFGSDGAPEISATVLEAAASATPAEPGVRLLLVQHRFNTGKLNAALHEVDIILDQYPCFAPALREKIRILARLGRKEDAERILQQLMETIPLDPEIHHDMAHIFEAKGDTASAIKEYEHLI